jgi:hypothetical protein
MSRIRNTVFGQHHFPNIKHWFLYGIYFAPLFIGLGQRRIAQPITNRQPVTFLSPQKEEYKFLPIKNLVCQENNLPL